MYIYTFITININALDDIDIFLYVCVFKICSFLTHNNDIMMIMAIKITLSLNCMSQSFSIFIQKLFSFRVDHH